MIRILVLIIMSFIFISSTYSINISSCQNITSSGFYELNQSISFSGTCLRINVSNVELNCNGHNISYGDGADGEGIDLAGQWNVNLTIRNCVIKDNPQGDHGIRGNNINNSLITNNTFISLNSDRTIALWWGYYNTITNNRFYQYGQKDNIVWGGSSSYNNFTYNTVYSNQSNFQDSLWLWNENNYNLFAYNNFTSIAQTNGFNTIHMRDTTGNTFVGNNIYAYGHSDGIAVEIRSVTGINNTFYNNYIFSELGRPIQISLASAQGNIFYNNLLNGTLSPNDDGVVNNWSNNGIGNFYANATSGNGFSQTCADLDSNGICDTQYTIPGTAVSNDTSPLSQYPYVTSSSSSSSSGSLFPFVNGIVLLLSLIYIFYKL